VHGSAWRHSPLGSGVLASVAKRILVVDDESSIRRLLVDLLASEGYVVTEASDGMGGLARLQELRPDVVILDLMMPTMSGWTFADKCRRMDGCRDLPIIAISAMFDMESAAATLKALGVRMCLPKPFDINALLSAVAEFV
jgi:two-component system, chemotaxis family, chemotaxis protein CheY